MDCRDIHRILNEGDLLTLTPQERARVNEHLDRCLICRNEWNVQWLLAEIVLPPTPIGLLDRICAAIDRFVAGNVVPFPGRRTVIITGVILMASAAATMMIHNRRDGGLTQVDEFAVETKVSSATSDTTFDEPVETVAGDTGGSTGARSEAPPPSSAIALDSATILVLPVDNRTSNSSVAQLAVDVRDKFEQLLIAEPGLNVVDSSTVPAFRASAFSDMDIARALGARVVVAISTDEGQRGDKAMIWLEVQDAQAESTLSINPMPAELLFRGSEQGLINILGGPLYSIRVNILGDARIEPPVAALASVYDPNSSPERRAATISGFVTLARSGGPPSAKEVVDALEQVLIISNSALDLQTAWEALRNLDATAELVPRALNALRTEQNELVRLEIVRYLRTHSESPDVRAELQYIVTSDRYPAVRDEAALALLTPEEQRQRRRETFLDTSLSFEDRLKVFEEGETWPMVDIEIANRLLEIVAEADDFRLRLQALLMLVDTNLPPLIDPLLELLGSENNAELRKITVAALGSYRNEPRVRAALVDAAENDTSSSVRSQAESILGDVSQD